MGFVKRRVSTSARVTPEAFDEHKAQFLLDAKCFVGMEKIPDSLVINWDQTGIQYIPGQWRRKVRSELKSQG